MQDGDNGSLENDTNPSQTELITVPMHDKPSHIIAIGASAGGLEAIEEFFENMPSNSGYAFVLIQHLSPDFKSLMNEILAGYTKMAIHRVTSGMPAKKNSIYLIPPKKNMIMSGGKLMLTDQEKTRDLNLPIDIFFRSLARDFGKKAIGIVLSGTGSDGSRGICDIHASGGLVLVQDEASAGFDGMPRSAIKTGVADKVTNPNKMPAELQSRLNHSVGQDSNNIAILPSRSAEDTEINDILELLRMRYGIEFKYYKAATIDRRIERRIGITHCRDIAEYSVYLTDNPSEQDSLYQDLLIGVTRFFRDPMAFAFLKTNVIPEIFKNAASKDGEIRVWTPGCATGEETYSLAMLLHEYALTQKDHHFDIKIFATDIHQNSLDVASAGTYAANNICDDIPAEYLTKYFTKNSKLYTVSREIRKMVIFAPQNVMSDPPFTNLNLLVCRNLMIYLDAVVQNKVYSLFHFSLNTNGYLFLGPSETVGELSEEFDAQSVQWKIYRKRRDIRLPDTRPLPSAMQPVYNKMGSRRNRMGRNLSTQVEPIVTWAYESLLNEYINSGFLVDEHYELLHIFGEAKLFIQVSEGRLPSNLLGMVNHTFSSALSGALHRANCEKAQVIFKNVKVDTHENKKQISLVVTPLYNKRTNKTFFFIAINEILDILPADPEPLAMEVDSHAIQQIQDLESELQYTKEHLQATNEELEASNEELQAANEEMLATNEELQSTNEELQSTNEELQSTNEELHSVNEELNTVNTEYQQKIDELTQLNNDMENFLTSTDIATLFLDEDLRVRKFTPAAARGINILERDIGRPFQDILHNIKIDKEELIEVIQKVVESDISIHREVECGQDVWMLMRILPYHNETAKVNGVVATFVDITVVKNTTTKLERYVEKLSASNQELQDFAYVASHDLQAPARHIFNFTELIRKKHNQQFNEEAREYFSHIEKAAKKMQSLISGLLEYSRVNTKAKPLESIDCSELLDFSIENLHDDIEKSGAIITRTSMPKLKIEKSQIQRVFINLLHNALKFNLSKTPKIDIAVIHDYDQWVFSFTDNGVGIRQEDLQKAFIIFKKLDTETNYEGTGLGLAICKRIIERHGGRIWVESTPGTGSTFYFTLPVTPSD